MSEYKRFVSYFYEYRHNKKNRNCGFVRTEIQKDRCSVDIHLKLPPYPFCPSFQVYAFIPEPDSLTGLFLGNASYHQGAVYGNFTIQPHGIRHTGFSLDDLGGLLIQADTGQIFATGWNDLPIYPETFHPWKEKPSIKAASVLQEDHVSPDPDISKAGSTASDPLPDPGVPLPHPDEKWQRIQNTYPHIQPFFDDEIHQCVRLSTKDIPILACNGFFIGDNRFLSHGSTSYGHFLMGRLNREDSSDYILGVPGCYDEKEHFLAAMFGFPNFKPSRNPLVRPGQFGYWYRILY